MLTTFKSDVYNCRNNLIKRQGQSSTGPVHSPTLNACTIPSSENVFDFLRGMNITTVPRGYLTHNRAEQNAFKRVLNLSDTSGCLARRRLQLSELDIHIVHRAGVKHQAPDASSRLRADGEKMTDNDDDLSVLNVKKKGTDEEIHYVHVCTE